MPAGRTGRRVVVALVVAAGFAAWALRPGKQGAKPRPGPAAPRPSPDMAVDSASSPVEGAPVAEPPRPRVEAAGLPGRVVDIRGASVEGASILLGPRETISAADGGFRLPEPTYAADGSGGTLLARKAGYAVAQVPLRADSPRPVVVVMPLAAPVVGLVTSDGGPVPGARIEVRDGAWSARTVTGADGTFELPDIRTGWGMLSASAPGFEPRALPLCPSLWTRNVLLRLERVPTCTIVVLDGFRAPVPRARVSVEWERGGLVLSGESDGQGRALEIPRRPGRGRVHVSVPGFADWRGPLPEALEGDWEIGVTAEASVIVRLPGTGDPAVRGAWSLALESLHEVTVPGLPDGEEGTADGPAGSPEPSYRRYVGSGPALGFRWETPGATGETRLTGAVPGGRYRILAVHRDPSGAENSPRVVAWTTAALPAGETTVNWTPPPLSTLRVTTVDPATGAGVRAVVSVRPRILPNEDPDDSLVQGRRTGNYRLATGDDGTGELLLPAGRYAARDPGAGAESGVVDADLGAGVTEVTIPVAVGRTVEGRLALSTGEPLPGRLVVLAGKDASRQPCATMTDDCGAFRIEGVPDGEYRVHGAGAYGESTASEPLDVRVPGPPVTVVVIPHAVRGRVRHSRSEPLCAVLSSERGGVEVRAPLDDGGGFHVAGLSRGSWRIDIREPSGQTLATGAVRVPDEGSVELTVWE